MMMDWSGVDYCDFFISCLDSYSDGTHSLQRIQLWESDAMLHFFKSILMKKQTHLQLGWPDLDGFLGNMQIHHDKYECFVHHDNLHK